MSALTSPCTLQFVVVLLLGACGQEKQTPPATQPNSSGAVMIPKAQPRPKVDPSQVLAVIETDKGTMEMEFLPGAPKTNQQVIELIQKRFYDLGMRFFRVDESVVQTGDPTNTGYEGSSKNIGLEVWEGQEFRTGRVGMSHSDEYSDSATSQVVFCEQDRHGQNE